MSIKSTYQGFKQWKIIMKPSILSMNSHKVSLRDKMRNNLNDMKTVRFDYQPRIIDEFLELLG